jgi:hypothetical protein
MDALDCRATVPFSTPSRAPRSARARNTRAIRAGIAFTLAALAFSPRARATPPTPVDEGEKIDKRPHDGWFQLDPPSDFGLFRFQTYATRMALPGFGVGTDDTPKRVVGIATPAQTGTIWGARAGFDVRIGPIFVEVFELSYGMGDGSATAMAQAGGQWMQVTRSPIQRFDIAIPGIGFQLVAPTGGMKVNFKWDVGYSYMWADATIKGPNGAVSTGGIGDSDIFSRAEIAGCKRMSSSFYDSGRVWGCLTAASNFYDKGWFNGASFGARLEF